MVTVGISFGDLALFAGALGLAARGGLRRADAAVAAVAGPGLLLLLAVLVSTLFNPASAWTGAVTLGLQYGASLVLIPLALAALDLDRRMTAALAFVAGLAVMVVVGLAIVTFAPSVESALITRGWMVPLGSGRNGLFSGVGELSKVAAMAIGLVYVLAVSGRIGAGRAAATVGVCGVALIVTRSASGLLTAAAVVAVIGVLHVAFRRRVRRQYPSVSSFAPLIVAPAGAAAAAWMLQFLDRRGGDYTASFTERIARPLSSSGVDAVGSASIRADLLRQGWASIGEHPVLGLGPEVFQQTSYYGAGVHVVPIMLWVELGLLGILAWVLMMVGVTLVCVTRWQTTPAQAIGALGVIAAVLVTHAAAPYLYGRVLIVPLLLALALTSAAGTTKSPPPPESDEGLPLRRRSVRRSTRAYAPPSRRRSSRLP